MGFFDLAPPVNLLEMLGAEVSSDWVAAVVHALAGSVVDPRVNPPGRPGRPDSRAGGLPDRRSKVTGQVGRQILVSITRLCRDLLSRGLFSVALKQEIWVNETKLTRGLSEL